MITANELRIGNIVHYNGATPYVDAITDKHVRLYGIQYGTDDGYYPLADIEGIILTPELLQECGFQKAKTNTVYYDFYLAPLNLSLYTETDGYCMRFFDTMHINKMYPCKYLHQLQNLYFALTGQELEIKSLSNA